MSQTNRSPWIHQLNAERPIEKLNGDTETDIAIVGAGIAGVSTAFFILEHTDKKVVLLDGGKLAHGATGHNAGHITSAFELSFEEMVRGFGLESASEGQLYIDGAWDLLEEMYRKASLSIPFSQFTGYGGLPTLEHVLEELRDNKLRVEGNITPNGVSISKSAPYIQSIPSEYSGLYTLVEQSEINEKLETEGEEYTAIVSYQTGLINSALFCQEIVGYLSTQYKNRFSLYEHTFIQKVALHESRAILDAGNNTITAGRVILCTNGFENFTILNHSGLDIDSRFHHEVNGCVGYMCGYLEPMDKPPAARYYDIPFGPEEAKQTPTGEPYYYITRRPYEYEKDSEHNIVCVGGPEFELADREMYVKDFLYPEEAHRDVDAFIKKTLHRKGDADISYEFRWHGLMGYTPNRVRLIGEEPKNSTLLYNLGCNGIGILPSIYGGKRISQIIAGEKLKTSMFDPKIS